MEELGDQGGHPVGYQGLGYLGGPPQWPIPFGGLDLVSENLALEEGSLDQTPLRSTRVSL